MGWAGPLIRPSLLVFSLFLGIQLQGRGLFAAVGRRPLVATTPTTTTTIASYRRPISNMVMKDKTPGSFDEKTALQPVNPFKLPANINNTAGKN